MLPRRCGRGLGRHYWRVLSQLSLALLEEELDNGVAHALGMRFDQRELGTESIEEFIGVLGWEEDWRRGRVVSLASRSVAVDDVAWGRHFHWDVGRESHWVGYFWQC